MVVVVVKGGRCPPVSGEGWLVRGEGWLVRGEGWMFAGRM